MADKTAKWKKNLHIPALIILQLIFIILFAIFVDYNPKSAKPNFRSKKEHNPSGDLEVYPSK